MARLLIVTDKQGQIKAAAKLNPENKHSPTAIECKSGESLHEIELPDELEKGGLGNLVNYYVATAIPSHG